MSIFYFKVKRNVNVSYSFILGENEDPRPYSKRSPSAHRDKLKKDRGTSRGIGVGLLKRRIGGRGGAAALRKDKPRDGQNDVCLFFAHGKCQRVRFLYCYFKVK